MDIILEPKKVPQQMPPYNWYELGDIRNVEQTELIDYYYKPIYQILPFKYLKAIFENKVLCFSNITKRWEDPYELFLYKHNIDVEGTPVDKYIEPFTKHTYGQCWSLLRDTDAMWRIYSPNKKSVRIKTTIGKMIGVLDQMRGIRGAVALFGKVNYLNKSQLENWLTEWMAKGSGELHNAYNDSLFIKRIEFSHESEMRFIIQDRRKIKENEHDEIVNADGFFTLKVDPYDFIEEIAFDPRINTTSFKELADEISILSGRIPLCRSDLYDFQQMTFHLKDTPMRVDIIIRENENPR